MLHQIRQLGAVDLLSWLLILGLVLMGIGVRLIGLDRVPPGFYIDEASIAYNAFSIATTGYDEHQISWPIYFKAFGEYKNPLYIYSQALVFKLTTISISTARLTSAIWGLAAVIVLGLLGYRYTQSRLMAVLAMLLLVWNPWHLLQSRIVFEAISLPACLIMVSYLLLRFDRTSKVGFYYWSSLCLGLAFYSYTAARFLSPALFLSALYLWHRRLSWKQRLVVFLLYGLCLVPAGLWESRFPGSLSFAYERASLFSHGEFWPSVFNTFNNYLVHFSPQFLLGSGDPYLRHSLGFRSGILFITLPLLVVGVGKAVRSWRYEPWLVWLVLGLLLSPLPAAITVEAPHALRSIGMVAFLAICSFVGLVEVHRFVSKQSLLWLGMVLVSLVEIVIVGRYLFIDYPPQAEAFFDAPLLELITLTQAQPEPYYLTNGYWTVIQTLWSFTYLPQPAPPLTFIDSTDTLDQARGTFLVDPRRCQAWMYPKFELLAQNEAGCVFRR